MPYGTYIGEIPSCFAGLMLFSCVFMALGMAFIVYLGEWFRRNH